MPSSLDAFIFEYFKVPGIPKPVRSHGGKAEDEEENEWRPLSSHGAVLQGQPGSELLKAEDVRTHVLAIFLRVCAKYVLLNAKQGKQALFYDVGTI